MKRILGILLLSLILHDFAIAGGVAVGNGGNIVRCSTKSELQSLDFVLTKNIYGRRIDIFNAESLEDSFKRISYLISEKYPKWHASFKEFSQLIMNHDESKKYIWRANVLGLNNVDEKDVHIPAWCRSSTGSIAVYQAIVRRTLTTSNQIIFEYDADLLLKLEKSDAVQISFLMIHEWLWNFSADINQIRKANYILHSTLLSTLSPAGTALELNKIGL